MGLEIYFRICRIERKFRSMFEYSKLDSYCKDSQVPTGVSFEEHYPVKIHPLGCVRPTCKTQSSRHRVMLTISSVSKWLHNTSFLEEILRHYDIEERCFIMNERSLHIGLEDVLYISGFPKSGKAGHKQ